jgi:hypothetical protein
MRAGTASNRKVDGEIQREAMAILSRPVYQRFGLTLASEYLAQKHKIQVSRETVRRWMIEAKLWRARTQKTKRGESKAATDRAEQRPTQIRQGTGRVGKSRGSARLAQRPRKQVAF